MESKLNRKLQTYVELKEVEDLKLELTKSEEDRKESERLLRNMVTTIETLTKENEYCHDEIKKIKCDNFNLSNTRDVSDKNTDKASEAEPPLESRLRYIEARFDRMEAMLQQGGHRPAGPPPVARFSQNPNINASNPQLGSGDVSEMIERQKRISHIIIYNVNEPQGNWEARSHNDTQSVQEILRDMPVSKSNLRLFTIGKYDDRKTRPLL